jgi:hypothetical protein
MVVKERPFNDLVPTRNRAARQNHRREVLLQITLPLALIFVVVVAAGVVAAGSVLPGSSPALLRDLSVIWLLFLTLLVSLVPLVLLIGLVYGVVRLIGMLPGWFFQVQRILERVAEAAATISRAVTDPINRLNSLTTGLRRLLGRGSSGRTRD